MPLPNATDSLRRLSGRLPAASRSPNPSWSQLGQAFVGLGKGRALAQRLWISINSSLQPGVRFYLTVLLTLAAANSLFILVSTSGAALQCLDPSSSIEVLHIWSLCFVAWHHERSLVHCIPDGFPVLRMTMQQRKRKLTGLRAADTGLLLCQGRPGCRTGDARSAPAGCRPSAAVLLQQDPAGARSEQARKPAPCSMPSTAQHICLPHPLSGRTCKWIVLIESSP